MTPTSPLTVLRDLWRAAWFTPSPPTNLGIWRIVFYGAVLVIHGFRDFPAWADVPDVFWHPIRLFGLVHSVVLPATALRVVAGVWTVALATSCLGLATRASTAVACGLGIYLLGLPHNFGKVHHGDALTVFVLVVMAFSRCGDGWSVDRLIALARRGTPAGTARPRWSGEYMWPIQVCRVLMTLVFLGAGTSKLRHSGLDWVLSDNMVNMLVNHHYSHHPVVSWSLYIAQQRWAATLMAATTVAFETGAPLVLFSRRLRWVLIPGLFMMQIGIWLLMGILFRDFLLLYLVWIPWDRLGNRLVARARGRRPYDLLYDGSCRLCRRTIAIILALDGRQRVQPYDVHADWPAVAGRHPELSQEACLVSMHVVDPRGRVTAGFDSYRSLAWVVPAGWLVLPLLYLPGVATIGRRVYASIAASRTCPIESPGDSRSGPAAWTVHAHPSAEAPEPSGRPR